MHNTKFSLEEAKQRAIQENQVIQDQVFSDQESRELYDRKQREIEIALLMRQARETANLSQADVAKRMQTTRSAVSRLESCGAARHSPSIETLLKYAQALGQVITITLAPMNAKRTRRR